MISNEIHNSLFHYLNRAANIHSVIHDIELDKNKWTEEEKVIYPFMLEKLRVRRNLIMANALQVLGHHPLTQGETA